MLACQKSAQINKKPSGMRVPLGFVHTLSYVLPSIPYLLMNYKADPNGKHEARAVKLGVRLKKRIQNHGYFESYKEFCDWGGQLFDCGGAAIRNSLKSIGLWRSGTRGKQGGDELKKMQDEIIEFASRRLGGLA